MAFPTVVHLIAVLWPRDQRLAGASPSRVDRTRNPSRRAGQIVNGRPIIDLQTRRFIWLHRIWGRYKLSVISDTIHDINELISLQYKHPYLVSTRRWRSVCVRACAVLQYDNSSEQCRWLFSYRIWLTWHNVQAKCKGTWQTGIIRIIMSHSHVRLERVKKWCGNRKRNISWLQWSRLKLIIDYNTEIHKYRASGKMCLCIRFCSLCWLQYYNLQCCVYLTPVCYRRSTVHWERHWERQS